MMELQCSVCGKHYKKPKEYTALQNRKGFGSGFFKRALKYCDDCRRKIEGEMIDRSLSKVIMALAETTPTQKERAK